MSTMTADEARAIYAEYTAQCEQDFLAARAATDEFVDLLAPPSPAAAALCARIHDYVEGRAADDDEVVCAADSLSAVRREPPAGYSELFAAGWADVMASEAKLR